MQIQSEDRAAARGSQRWLQLIVNNHPELLNAPIRSGLGLSGNESIEWLSPLRDSYTEYCDNAFLERLGVKLEAVPLGDFWPASGPRWDGLAKTHRGDLILVEAKSHVAELMSACTAVSPASRTQIESSLAAARNFFRVRKPVDWTQPFYQYANRLAHLYLLRERNGHPAWLVNIYFVNDEEMRGPRSIDHWRGALEMAKHVLGLGKTTIPHVIDVFIDVKQPPLNAKREFSA